MNSLEQNNNFLTESETLTGRLLEIVVDYEKTDQVLGILLKQYCSNDYPYNLENTRVPHHPDHMPEHMPRGGKEHASFLWNSCYYMRGGIKSVEAFKRLSKMYDNPDTRYLFDLSKAQYADPAAIEAGLKESGLGFRTPR